MVIVLFALLTGGRLLPGELSDGEVGAVLMAGAFFVVATAWSWWRFRARLQRRRR